MLRSTLRSVFYACLGALSLAAFYDASTLHGRYEIQRFGVSAVPRDELAFLFWYLVWGSLAVVALGLAFRGRPESLFLRTYLAAAQRPRECVAGLCLLVFAAILVLRHTLLLGQPIADDELTYELSARNLALGRITGRPELNPEFLKNIFVLVDAHRWHGKYPLGHSLLLAPFELLDRVDLLGALLAVGSLLATFAVSRRFVGERAAFLATVLLAISPHFVLTHATLFSQTTSTLCMLLAAYTSLRHRETGAHRWLVALGLSLGFGIFTRPFPGLLIALVLTVDKLIALVRARPKLRSLTLDVAALGGPFGAMLALFVGTNYLQSGSLFTSGYHDVHGSLGMFSNHNGELTNSVGGALVRENAWLFGWPCSLCLLFFARVNRWPVLFWSLISTGIAYRLMVPKTVVATTGPIYVTELVPWLCMASASGASRLVELLARLGVAAARERLAGFVVAACLVGMVAFAPVEARAIYRGALARDDVFQQLREAGVSRALVFGRLQVAPDSGASWAYFPPNPWPDLRDDILFLRVPARPDGLQLAWKLWRTRYADRPALLMTAKKTGVLLKRFEVQAPPLPEPVEPVFGQSRLMP
jgi:hypothetical protein